MTFHVLLGVLLGLGLYPAVAVAQQPHTLEQEAERVVQKFAQFDFEGFRLDSEGHQAIWELTIDNGAPPESPVFIVRDYRTSAVQNTSTGNFRISVDYNVIGLITEGVNGLSFRPRTYVRKAGSIWPVASFVSVRTSGGRRLWRG